MSMMLTGKNPRTVCQRTPMDDRTDADAYP